MKTNGWKRFGRILLILFVILLLSAVLLPVIFPRLGPKERVVSSLVRSFALQPSSTMKQCQTLEEHLFSYTSGVSSHASRLTLKDLSGDFPASSSKILGASLNTEGGVDTAAEEAELRLILGYGGVKSKFATIYLKGTKAQLAFPILFSDYLIFDTTSLGADYNASALRDITSYTLTDQQENLLSFQFFDLLKELNAVPTSESAKPRTLLLFKTYQELEVTEVTPSTEYALVLPKNAYERLIDELYFDTLDELEERDASSQNAISRFRQNAYQFLFSDSMASDHHFTIMLDSEGKVAEISYVHNFTKEDLAPLFPAELSLPPTVELRCVLSLNEETSSDEAQLLVQFYEDQEEALQALYQVELASSYVYKEKQQYLSYSILDNTQETTFEITGDGVFSEHTEEEIRYEITSLSCNYNTPAHSYTMEYEGFIELSKKPYDLTPCSGEAYPILSMSKWDIANLILHMRLEEILQLIKQYL